MLVDFIEFMQVHRNDIDYCDKAKNELKKLLPCDKRSEADVNIIFEVIMNEEIPLGSETSVNLISHKVYQNGKQIELSNVETLIVETLAKRKGEIVPYNEIIGKVWGYAEDNSILKVNVSHIRSKINIPITSIKGIGYKLGSG